MHTSVVKAVQNLVGGDASSAVEEVMYPLEEDRETLLTAFGRNSSLPVVTIPGEVLTERARPGEGEHTRMSSVHLTVPTRVVYMYCIGVLWAQNTRSMVGTEDRSPCMHMLCVCV